MHFNFFALIKKKKKSHQFFNRETEHYGRGEIVPTANGYRHQWVGDAEHPLHHGDYHTYEQLHDCIPTTTIATNNSEMVHYVIHGVIILLFCFHDGLVSYHKARIDHGQLHKQG